MLTIIIGIYAFTVIFALVLLAWILVIELRENKIKRSDTMRELFYCIILSFIPIFNIHIIKNAIKQL